MSMIRKTFHGLLIIISVCIALNSHIAWAAADYDIVILNGRVIDPETHLDGVRSVGIKGDRIVVVTKKKITGRLTIDATGKVVAPGFIDLHAHGQRIPVQRIMAFDGVTTGLELESGTYPISDFYEKAAAEGRAINYGASVSWAHLRIAEKTGTKPRADLRYFFQHIAHTGWREELTDAEELQSILLKLQEGLDEGGLGIGVLLGYAPGSGRKEYYAVNELAAKNGVPTFTHARYLSAIEPKSSFEGFQEMVGVAASTGAHMHISHLNSISNKDIDEIAPMIEAAQENGARITVEAYPYGAAATGIGAAMFRGERWQERLGGIALSDFTVSNVPLDEETFVKLQNEAPETLVIFRWLKPDEHEDDQSILDRSILFPGGAIASDGGVYLDSQGNPYPSETWPLPVEAQTHPRTAGTYSKFLRHYVRETKKLSLIEAIAKISFIPANILEESVPQMKNKGRIQKGADADIVIFDFDSVSERSTFETPSLTSVGFEHVIVGGVPLISNGVLDEAVLPGEPIRRPISQIAEGSAVRP